MSAFPQGLVTFPGLNTFKSAEYTASQGIAPGVCTIEMPQELVGSVEAQGDLTLSYGDQSITLYSCVVDAANISRSGGGFIARVQIYDRRWAWQFGYISGHYNLPGPGTSTAGGTATGDGTAPPLIRADTEKDPQGLASLCLDAMGEEDYDVSVLPNSSRPERHWSYENPAQALEQLCESLGCRVVLDLASDSVQVVVVGDGGDLPEGPVQWVSEGLKPAEPPSSLLFVGGQTVQQGFLELNAVGRDTSGSIVDIDDLSYTPDDGWESEPTSFPDITSEPAHTYAEESIYRWWQPVVPFTAPDGTNVTDLKQLILFDRQLDTNQDPDDPNGATTQRPEILGYFDPTYAQSTEKPTTLLTYHGSIQVDQNRCLVITADQLLANEEGENEPAELWVKTSFSLRDVDTREPVHYTLSYPLDGSPNLTQPQIVRHDELTLQVRGAFGGGPGTDNSSVISQAANYYLDAIAAQYQSVQSLDVPYVGIVPIQVDGTICQVTYSIQSGEGGACLTRASLNTEHSHYIPKYERRRDKTANQAVNDRAISQQALMAQQQQNQGQPFVR
jgi:hypothetical protein